MKNIIVYTTKNSSDLADVLAAIDDTNVRIEDADKLRDYEMLNAGLIVIEDVPNPGIPELFRKLKDAGYSIVIHTCRALTPDGRRAVVHWLTANHMIELIDNVTALKPIARCYVDDRAIHFEGCEGLLNAIEQFCKGE